MTATRRTRATRATDAPGAEDATARLLRLAEQAGAKILGVALPEIPRSKSGPCLLALDVSSTAAGWAVFHGRGLARFGLIRPKASLPALERVDEIVDRTCEIVDEASPDEIVMEISSGKVHGRIGRASGLSVLGTSQGAVREAIRHRAVPLVTVSENEWTKSKAKAMRASDVAGMYLQYKAFADLQWDAKAGCKSKTDPGFDIADAIGIGHWQIGKREELALLARLKSKWEGEGDGN